MKSENREKRCVISDIKVPVTTSEDEIVRIAQRKYKRLSKDFSDFKICRLSVDARKKDDVKYVASVSAAIFGDLPEDDEMKKIGISVLTEPECPEIPKNFTKPGIPPVIVGFGPAGMFAGLVLAEAGLCPTVIERGGSVYERENAVKKFLSGGEFSAVSNIQFGAGGAGTFSDGKLVTRINDGLCNYVLRRFYEFGAPEEILYRAKPHIGTDRLLSVVDNIEKRIVSLGGKVLYNSKMTAVEYKNGRAYDVILSDGTKIQCSSLMLGIGHSAKDTYRYLLSQKFIVEPKPFSVGVRIEHLQSDIDSAMYGKFAGIPGVPHAEYNLSCHVGDRGVYTFCMCPGGEVVAAASEEEGVVTNGMSGFARDGRNANAAVAVSVFPSDYGETPEGAMEFQRGIEHNAFVRAGSDYSAPAQTVGSFLGKSDINSAGRVKPTYRGGNVDFSDICGIFPKFVTSALAEGLVCFGRKIKGYDANDAILTGPETRTSAPVRILRTEDRCAVGFENIYPMGEGAGYAGGITSAAIDGIRSAMALMKKISK